MSHVQMATVWTANMDTRDELKQEITIYIALCLHQKQSVRAYSKICWLPQSPTMVLTNFPHVRLLI